MCLRQEATTAEAGADQKTIGSQIRAFGRATAPQQPGQCAKWKLPPSFFLACIGIKAQYFAPFGFTAFSNKIYATKFGQSQAEASFLSGFISLIAGLLGPVCGPVSDKYGQRAGSLAAFTVLSALGFVFLAVTDGSSATPLWIASFLFALQYGFGDTVRCPSPRSIGFRTRRGLAFS